MKIAKVFPLKRFAVYSNIVAPGFRFYNINLFTLSYQFVDLHAHHDLVQLDVTFHHCLLLVGLFLHIYIQDTYIRMYVCS